jgi:hypothetical protein
MNIRRGLSHGIFPYVALLAIAQTLGAAELGVSSSGRHFTLNSKPFFWLGDTVWLLAQLPSREEVELYLRTRAEQGFTVIQLTAVMGEERVWGTARASSRGDLPFIDNDVLKPAVTPGNHPGKIKAPTLEAKWLNPATGEQQSGSLDQQSIAPPAGREDALLHITGNK